MNDKQKLYCAISGYGVRLEYTGASDSYYYDCHTEAGQLGHLEAYFEWFNQEINAEEKYMGMDDLREVNNLLQAERLISFKDNEHYHAFAALNREAA